MFEDLDRRKQQYVFIGLKLVVENAAELMMGFHNGDPGHKICRDGAAGKVPDGTESDSPEKNSLFKMLSDLSKKFKKDEDIGYLWWQDFSTWQQFCKFATQCCDEHRRGSK